MGHDKEINLIPGSKSIKLKSLQPITRIIGGFLLLAIFFSVIGAMQQKKINDLYAESATIQKEISTLNYLNENLITIEEKWTELQKRKDTINIIEKEKVKVMAFLDKLKLYVPTNVRIVSLSVINGEEVEISFEAGDTYDIARLMVKLEEMDAFERVETDTLPINDKVNICTFNLKLKKDSEQVSENEN